MKKPKYVETFCDRYGQTRYYFRRSKSLSRVPLPNLMPWHPDFLKAYEAAKAGQAMPVVEAPRADMSAGSFTHYMVKYIASPQFKALGTETRNRRRQALENFAETICADGKPRGARQIASMSRFDLAAILNGLESRHTAASTLKALRMMFAYLETIQRDIVNPTLGCKIAPPKRSDGFFAWQEEHIVKFAKKHPITSRARLAMAVMLYTGLRLSDALQFGPDHIKNGRIKFKPHKTKDSSGVELNIPLHPAFAKILKAHEPFKYKTFLVSEWQKPYARGTFSTWMRRWCDEADLPQCTSHGLRKSICIRLALGGCDVRQIASITGHRNWKVLQKYVDQIDSAKNSDIGMKKLVSADAAMKMAA